MVRDETTLDDIRPEYRQYVRDVAAQKRLPYGIVVAMIERGLSKTEIESFDRDIAYALYGPRLPASGERNPPARALREVEVRKPVQFGD
jgi:hypothetical protein